MKENTPKRPHFGPFPQILLLIGPILLLIAPLAPFFIAPMAEVPLRYHG